MKVRVVLLCLVAAFAVASMIRTASPVRAQNPVEPASRTAVEELGRLLFWDPILSGSRDIACATCHHPDFAYADDRELSLGTGSIGLGSARVDMTDGVIPVVKRNSPTILNVGFNGANDNRRRRRFNRQFDGTLASVNQERAPMFWDNRVRSLEDAGARADQGVRGDARHRILRGSGRGHGGRQASGDSRICQAL